MGETFFQALILAVLLHFSSAITKVTKTVKDSAVLSCDYNISADELTRVRIYWQRGNEMVLTVTSGKLRVWPKYKNRTVPNLTMNTSITIRGLRLSDSGTYDCIIQKLEKGTFRLGHLTKVMLLVRADFPVPNITVLQNPSTNIKRIICSTSGGSPKPHLSWLENGKELNAISTRVFQDSETELYTISSELDFNVTTNHSFVCLVKYGDLTVSQIFNWQKFEPPPSPFPDPTLLRVVIPVVVVVAAVIVVIAVIQRSSSNSNCHKEEDISSLQ